MKIPKIPGFDQQAIEKYAKNTGWLMIARVGSLVIKVLIGFMVSNYLGATQNGIYNYPMTIATFFIAAAALGLDGFVTRELIRYPEKKKALLGTAFILKTIGGIAVLPMIYLFYGAVNDFKPAETPFSYVLIVSCSGIVQAFNIIDSYFQSKAQGKLIMIVQIAGNILSAFIKLALILSGLPIEWFIISLLFDTLLLSGGYIYVYTLKGSSIFNWKFDLQLAKYLLHNSWPLAFSAVLVSIYMRIDQLMIKNYLDIKSLGIYSTVVQLAESWYFIPVAIVTAVFPAIMNARRDDPIRYKRRMQNMYDLMVWISLSLAIFMTFAAPYIYKIFYKPEFHPGAHVLSVHIWAGIFAFLGTASGQFLIAEGYTKLALVRTAAGAIINILLNMIWIPQYGIMGAAIATLVAYFSSTFFILLFPKTREQGLMMFKSLLLFTVVQKLRSRR
ncbi:probable polysaccharide biosynthesis protein [Pedobacter sp. BAL39]|uniref:flippase n=1 Tax=Pedobacter sp. BAL39 TaxID=391596 RepID=UPI0001559AD1|nr:flippase [Pedobacter sp. BAL39]EDM37239.1 probable polysaccharide biosynthesis protein [Pedobacter sp. BAL39]